MMEVELRLILDVATPTPKSAAYLAETTVHRILPGVHLVKATAVNGRPVVSHCDECDRVLFERCRKVLIDAATSLYLCGPCGDGRKSTR